MAYRLTRHARQRIKSRRLRVEWLLAALSGYRYVHRNGLMYLTDPATRTTLVVAKRQGIILTAFKLDRDSYRKMFEKKEK